MGCISHRRTAHSRAQSVRELANGTWKQEFDALVSSAEKGDRQAYVTLKLKRTAYGLWNYPELRQYAIDTVNRLAPLFEEW